MSNAIPPINIARPIRRTDQTPQNQKISSLKRGAKIGLSFAALSNQVQQSHSAIIPTGTVAFFDLSSCPNGWDSVTELAGRTPVGTGTYTGTNEAGSTETSTYLLNQEGGEMTHQLTETELPITRIYSGFRGPIGYADYTGLYSDPVGQGLSGWDYYTDGRLYDKFGADQSHNNLGPYRSYTACKKNSEQTDEEIEISSLRSDLTTTQTELEDLKKKLE
jgi:hypothetical protein